MPTVGTTHNIELGGRYYMIRPGSYMKRAAPQFGARFATGDPDFNNFSFWQHWAQRCFIGGVGAEDWADDAMYDEGIGVNTSEHEKVTLSRDLARGTGSNWGLNSQSATAAEGYKAIIYNSKLYVLTMPTAGTNSHLWEYEPGTDGWSRITDLDGRNIEGRSIAVFDGKLWIGGVATGTTNPKLVYAANALTSWSTQSDPAGVPSQPIRAMRAFQQKLYVAYGTEIWRLKHDLNWDGNTVFYKARMMSESNYMVSMEVHLGFLYMLSQNGHVHRTDGNSTFDIWNWDGQTQGVAIKSFDGRLFILTFEYTNTTNVGYGVLYQMSGSAVTELKRWGDEDQATRIGNMVVYDRKMFYGASNGLGMARSKDQKCFGVAVYDPIEDAHSIVAANHDTTAFSKGAPPQTNWIVDDQIFFGGFLFAFVRGHGGFKTPYKKDDRTRLLRKYDTTSTALGATNGGYFTTSTYDAGTPGVRKLWRKIIVDYSMPSVSHSIIVEYSLDNGDTWTALTAITTTGNRVRKEFWLDNKISDSFKLRFTLRSTTSSSSPTLYGYVVSYLPLLEPNWIWTFTIVMSEKQVLVDGTEETNSVEEELTFLGTAFRTKQLLHFTDIDGTSWAASGPGVLIHDIDFRIANPSLKPNEGEVVVTLLEAVETYG